MDVTVRVKIGIIYTESETYMWRWGISYTEFTSVLHTITLKGKFKVEVSRGVISLESNRSIWFRNIDWTWKDQGIPTPLQAYRFGHMPMPRQYWSNHRSHHLGMWITKNTKSWFKANSFQNRQLTCKQTHSNKQTLLSFQEIYKPDRFRRTTVIYNINQICFTHCSMEKIK
jgi:hypothetical protein